MHSIILFFAFPLQVEQRGKFFEYLVLGNTVDQSTCRAGRGDEGLNGGRASNIQRKETMRVKVALRCTGRHGSDSKC